MINSNILGLGEFLRANSGMVLKPVNGSGLHIEGQFGFTASAKTFDPITDSYQLNILIPSGFPREIPVVYELQGRIPRDDKHHVNRDGSLCLGSPIRMLWKIAHEPTISGYAGNCLIPYLFSISYKLRHGTFPFGELDHGSPGELSDYVDLFRLKTLEHVQMTLRCLGMKKRRANKLPCPCACGQRLGKCRFNKRLRGIRQLAERTWFRSIASRLR